METTPYRTWVEISRERIARNYRNVRAAVGPDVEIAAVVKSDAYGHGAVEVSRILEREGARWFAVSTAEEGIALRRAGIAADILVMADSLPFIQEPLAEFRLTPVVHALEDLPALDEFAARLAAPLKFHLKIDSGMGRLGTRSSAATIARALAAVPHVALDGLMSHFASAADYSTARSDKQVRAFNRLSADLRKLGVNPAHRHMSGTTPIAYARREAWHNMVRPGHALYGYLSMARGDAPTRILEVAPAIAWKARVLAVKDLPSGALVGYGGMFRTERATRIAILGAGYADGLPHRLSNRGNAIAGGKLVPILGAVSMDLTTIDVTDCPAIAPGGSVTLLGSEGEASINAQEMARMAGTISYDVLCGIRTRVKRVYV
jgi:alanine racemase